MRRAVSTSIVVVLALLGAACSDGDDEPTPGPSPSTTAAPSPTSTVPPSVGPAGPESPSGPEPTETGMPFVANTEPDTAQGEGEPVLVTDIEVTRADGFDRVVLVLDGDGAPGWTVEYVDDPRQQGSGDEVDVEGDATLAVRLDNTTYPSEDGQGYEGPDRIAPEDTVTIEEVVFGSTFEGITEVWIGTAGELPFRAQLFSDPARVVIDVVHADRTG